MSNNSFSHTSSAGVTTAITFDTAGHMATDPNKVSLNVIIDKSLGGSDYVLELGSAKKSFPFSFIVPRVKVASETDMADAMAFLILVSATETFSWTDENGTVRTVRQMSPDFEFSPIGGRWMQCTVELKEQ